MYSCTDELSRELKSYSGTVELPFAQRRRATENISSDLRDDIYLMAKYISYP
jgi:hypothetical protein